MDMPSKELVQVFELPQNDGEIVTLLRKISEALQKFPKSDEHLNEVEQLVLAKLSVWDPKNGSVFEFLLKTYTACSMIKSSERLANECKYFITSYAGLVLLMPTMFDQDPSVVDLGPGLLGKLIFEQTVSFPTRFVFDLIERYKHDCDSFKEIFEGVFAYLSGKARELDLLALAPVSALFSSLDYLVSFKPVADLIPSLSIWLPDDLTAPAAAKTLLGSLFSISTDKPGLLDTLLPNREDPALSQPQWFQTFTTLRMALKSIQSQLHNFLYKLIKTSPELKEAVISFLARIAQLNVNRTKMHVDHATISPNGLIGNIFAVLLKFSHPFLGPSNPKATLIDSFYYEIKDRIPIDGATKINMSDAEYAKFKVEIGKCVEAKPANFITEIYFLTVYYFRLGYISQLNELKLLQRHYQELKTQIDRFEQQDSPNTMLPGMQQTMLKRAKAQLLQIQDSIRLNEVWLLDESTLEDVYLLVSLILDWMLKASKASADGSLSSTPEPRFISLPEHFVECVADFALFVSWVMPAFWLKNGRNIDALVQFMITFLDRHDYIKNPYLRSKFIEILHGWTTSSCEHIFDLYPITVNHLAAKIMRFYIEVERTGASSQFYDKFNIRFHLAVILKCLWSHPLHKERIREAANDRNTFVQFINFLLNDTSFLLDEAMAKLVEIHNFQVDQESGEIDRLSGEERETRLSSFSMAERQCVSYTQLAGETLNMLSYLTREIHAPFLQDEVINHLAAMLDFDLIKLAGPKCRDLKVKQPEKYGFEPKVWLGTLLRTFLNLGGEEKFLQAIARDERSFDTSTFAKASSLMARLGLGTLEEVQEFDAMTARVVAIRESQLMAEEDLGDIPDEFLDPLMAYLMDDPVILTTSGITVDRKTIVAHLLNNQIDPFNRMPITMDQVVPNVELKAKIDAFLEEKRKK